MLNFKQLKSALATFIYIEVTKNMPRPMKWRKVCCLPESSKFGPLDLKVDDEKDNIVRMTVDEYEAIRLIDLEGFTQEECAKQMDVARTPFKAFTLKPEKRLPSLW